MGVLSTSVRRPTGGQWEFHLSRVGLLCTACASTLVANVAFNYARFGSFLNSIYLDPTFIVPSWKIQLSYFLGAWFSPNAGIIFFWPSFFLLLVLSGLCAVKAVRVSGERLAAVPWSTVVLVTAGVMLGLSKWYAPFGWVCWGPRLLLPWLPAVAYVIVAYYGHEIEDWTSRTILRGNRAWITGAALSVVSFPQFGILFRPDIMMAFFSEPDAQCPKVAIIQQNAAYYYHWMNHGIWTKSAFLLKFYSRTVVNEDFPYALACAFLLTCLVGIASRASPSTPA
jgi:hypothetical protein